MNPSDPGSAAYGTTGGDAPFETTSPPLTPRQMIRPLRPFVPWTIALAAFYLVSMIAGRLLDVGNPIVAGTLAFLIAPVAIGLIVVGGLFFMRAGENADLMGARDRRWGSYWGMLSWVIPVANVVLPWLYVREVWKASAPQAGPEDWRSAAVPGWMVAWWAAWGGAQLLGVVAGVMGYAVGIKAGLDAAMDGPGTVPVVTTPVWLDVLNWMALALVAVALPFFVRLLLALRDRQESRAQRLTALAATEGRLPPTGTF